MLLFCRETGTMFSDIYGFEGSKELRSLAKKMRLDRVLLKEEGHPVDEHYLIPAAKHPGMAARGVTIVTAEELRERQQTKRAQVRLVVSNPKPLPQRKVEVADEAWHPPSYANRRRDRQKNWRQADAA